MRVHPLEVTSVSVTELTQHPDNANNGDVDALEESIEINGFYAPITVQRSTGHILAGNHRYLVALRKGTRELPVIYLDVDDEAAKRIMLADNAITRRGFDDEAQLADNLQELYATDLALHGTGYTMKDYEKLLADIDTPLKFDPEPVVDERMDRETAPNRALHFSVTPIVSPDGVVYELAIQKEGMGPISRIDANSLRRAMGMAPFTREEVKAFDAPQWM